MLYYLGNARTEEQRAEMVRLETAGICIFCPEYLGKEHGKPVILSNRTWSLVANDYPYPGTKHHYMLIPHDHVTDATQLSEKSQLGYFDLLSQTKAYFGLTYFGIAARNGDPRYTGATIFHHHVQLVVGEPEGDSPPVVLYLSSRP